MGLTQRGRKHLRTLGHKLEADAELEGLGQGPWSHSPVLPVPEERFGVSSCSVRPLTTQQPGPHVHPTPPPLLPLQVQPCLQASLPACSLPRSRETGLNQTGPCVCPPTAHSEWVEITSTQRSTWVDCQSGHLCGTRRPPMPSATPGMHCDHCAHSKPPSLET